MTAAPIGTTLATALTIVLAASIATAQDALLPGPGRGDGLASDAVRCVASDARGYLWFGTADGLSRWDGARFSGYGIERGLATTQVDAIAVTADGSLGFGMHGPWVALYDPRTVPPIRSIRVTDDHGGRNVCAACFDQDGVLWFTTESGLFAVIGDRIERVASDERSAWYSVVVRDPRGGVLWVTSGEVVQCRGGSVTRRARPDAQGIGNVWSLVPIAADRWFVLDDARLVELELADDGPRTRTLPVTPPPEARFTCLCRGDAGDLWVGTTAGLLRCASRADGGLAEPELVRADVWVRALCVDRDGDLWIATDRAGLLVRSALPFEVVRRSDADSGDVIALWRRGDAVVAATDRGSLLVARGGGGFDALTDSRLPDWSAATSRSAVDGAGDLWLGTASALFRVRGASLFQASPGGGLVVEPVVERHPLVVERLTVDGQGRVLGRAAREIVVLDPRDADRPITRLPLPPGCPSGMVFRVDAARRAWIATAGGLLRADANEVVPLRTASGEAIHADSVVEDEGGRTWLLSWRKPGVELVTAEHDDVLELRTFGIADGMPDGLLRAGASRGDRTWFAGPGGLAAFDPRTGRARALRWPDRVRAGSVHALLVANDDTVWIASGSEVHRLAPERWRDPPPAPLFVDELDVAGERLALPDGGSAGPLDLVVPYANPNVALRFASPAYRDGPPRYRHRLRPIDVDFSAPSALGAIRLAGLAPGDYALEVCVAGTGGAVASPQLVVRIAVPGPFWRSPFAWLLVALSAVALVHGFHRARVRRLLALEAIRRRIAGDLHDELGAGLAQVAVSSEVAKRRDEAARHETLDSIACLARDLRSSLSDIVWAVDPARDDLPSLVHRLRDVATTLFPGESCRLEFEAPRDEAIASVRLTPDRRRHLFLIAKEALANAARHSGARCVSIVIELSAGELLLRVKDDGRGFADEEPAAGHGLPNLRRRAAELGGRLAIDSAPWRGTTIELRVRLS